MRVEADTVRLPFAHESMDGTAGRSFLYLLRGREAVLRQAHPGHLFPWLPDRLYGVDERAKLSKRA